MSRLVSAYVGLGSNLGRRLQQIEMALCALQATEGIHLIAISRIYQSRALLLDDAAATAPLQPDFLNAVVWLSTSLPSRWLLKVLLQIENKLGRTRHQRWAPRTLDLDLLLYGQQRISLPDLTVPHPEIHKRAFVLYPLQDVAENLIIPGLGTLQRLVQRCDKSGLCCLPKSDLI